MTKDSTRAQILAAAVQVAARRGVTGASMDEIAAVASVSKGSLYYNFTSKDAIFAELVQTGLQRLIDVINDARRHHPDPFLVARDVLTEIHRSPDLSRVLAAEIFRADRPWHSLVVAARGEIASVLSEILREGVGDERVRERITSTSGAAFFGALIGAGFDWILTQSDESIESIQSQAFAGYSFLPRRE